MVQNVRNQLLWRRQIIFFLVFSKLRQIFRIYNTKMMKYISINKNKQHLGPSRILMLFTFMCWQFVVGWTEKAGSNKPNIPALDIMEI